MKLVAGIFVLLSCASYAHVVLNVSVLRNGFLTLSESVPLELKRSPMQVYKDELTYIEAELIKDSDDEQEIQYTVATKCETGAYVVRGLPRIITTTTKGLGMGSLQCDGKGESFTMITAVAQFKN